MNRYFSHKALVTVVSGVFLLAAGISSTAQVRQTRDFDPAWKFMPGDPKGAEAEVYDDKAWRNLDLPHDWSIESDLSEKIEYGASIGYLPKGIGWYRKTFTINKKDIAKEIWIEFDGVYRHTDVWVNGHHLGFYPNGYSSFSCRLTGHLNPGTNVISVRADNSKQPDSRWYTGSGIYRHVRLIVTDPLHVKINGTYVTTPAVEVKNARVRVLTTVENNSQAARSGEVVSVITDDKGTEVARIGSRFSAEPGKTAVTEQTIDVQDPKLWSVDTPILYTLKTVITEKGKSVDDYMTPFGIRTIEFDAMKGFLLNGKQVKMKGVNLHHTIGGVGAAVPEAVWERQLRILREMGCNAIRTSHNPVAPEFLDLCDKLGFLVMDESFDEWQISRGAFGQTITYGYHYYFDQWYEHDLLQMIHRDRNHPSVVIWSVGNEVMDQTKPTGHETLKKLSDICHREDPTRPVTMGCNLIARVTEPATTLEFLKGLDIVGYNYVDRTGIRRELYYTIDKLAHPEWKMIGTENSSVYSYRGEYSLGNDPKVPVADYTTLMIDPGELWKYTILHDFVIGDFMWTGIDYLGEARWPNINPPCGVVDRCGFPKDSYFFYQSIWTEKPMLHLLPHWNWDGREGQIIPVLGYTNCDAVELFLNGKSYGEKRRSFPRKGPTIVGNWSTYNPKNRITTTDLHLSWDVPYEPGIIKAVGKRNGEVVAEAEIKTTGQPTALRLSVDKNTVKADSRDVVHMTVEVVDKDGNVVPYADNLVEFNIEGQGKLIGVDNGSHRDYNSMKISKRNAFHGLCLGIVQSNGKEGVVKLTARSEKLGEASVTVTASK